MVYTVTLNPALDYLMKINETKEDIQTASSTIMSYGGKGINVSVILKNLGIDSIALGFCGGHSGEMLKSLLKKEKICFKPTQIDGDTRINVKIVGTQSITVNAQGPQITLNNEQELFKELKQIEDGDWLVLSGSIPPSMGKSAYERLLNQLNGRRINLVADTTGEPLKMILQHKPFLVKPNNFELEEIFNVKIENKDEITKYARQLQDMGAKNVLVSMGKAGMLLLDENGNIYNEPIIERPVKNTIGCGDSSVAGFVAGYIKRQNYKYALHLSSVCANATAFSDKLATKKEIEELM